jgi:hypothetical protein
MSISFSNTTQVPVSDFIASVAWSKAITPGVVPKTETPRAAEREVDALKARRLAGYHTCEPPFVTVYGAMD